MIHSREFLPNTTMWLCITLHHRALQTQHKYAQKINYTLKWFWLRSTDAL